MANISVDLIESKCNPNAIFVDVTPTLTLSWLSNEEKIRLKTKNT